MPIRPRHFFAVLLIAGSSLLPAQSPPLPAGDQLRPQVREVYAKEVYGAAPNHEAFELTEGAVIEPTTPVLNGLGFRRQVALGLENSAGERRTIDLMIYYPRGAEERAVPTIVLLNFLGNQALVADPEIRLNGRPIFTGSAAERGIVDRRATAASRGKRLRRFPIEYLLEQGYAVITAGYQDFVADDDASYRETTRKFYGLDPAASGALSIWAAGYRWLADYALRQEAFRTDGLFAAGHSRLGKAVLLAAARDERIAGVLVNGSGCGGATLFQRARGETIADITTNFPHWFRDSFHAYRGRDAELPLDQHWLLAAIAPRPLLVSAAEEDRWADPEGEFLALRAALPAYGPEASLPEAMPLPAAGTLHGTGPVGFHYRPGKHDLLLADWSAFVQLLKQ